MKNKAILLITPAVATLLILFGYSTILAQTPKTSTPSATPDTTLVISDYAKDVQDGERETANDVDAQNNQKHTKENEDVEGREEIEDVETHEAIEPEEAVEPKEVENETENENEGEKSDLKSEGDSKDVESNGDKQSVDYQQDGINNSDK